MTPIRTVLAVAALAAALSSCGGPAPAAPPSAENSSAPVAPAPAAGTATGTEEGAVESAFRGYYQALQAKDYPAACARQSPEITNGMIASLQQQGVTAGTCEEAISSIYAIPGAAATVDKITSSTEIQGVAVQGDSATVTWSADRNGQRKTVSTGMRRTDGRWRLQSSTPA